MRPEILTEVRSDLSLFRNSMEVEWKAPRDTRNGILKLSFQDIKKSRPAILYSDYAERDRDTHESWSKRELQTSEDENEKEETTEQDRHETERRSNDSAAFSPTPPLAYWAGVDC